LKWHEENIQKLNQVNQEGIRVLMKSLGPADAIRFLQQFDPGYGDYTAEWHIEMRTGVHLGENAHPSLIGYV